MERRTASRRDALPSACGRRRGPEPSRVPFRADVGGSAAPFAGHERVMVELRDLAASPGAGPCGDRRRRCARRARRPRRRPLEGAEIGDARLDGDAASLATRRRLSYALGSHVGRPCLRARPRQSGKPRPGRRRTHLRQRPRESAARLRTRPRHDRGAAVHCLVLNQLCRTSTSRSTARYLVRPASQRHNRPLPQAPLLRPPQERTGNARVSALARGHGRKRQRGLTGPSTSRGPRRPFAHRDRGGRVPLTPSAYPTWRPLRTRPPSLKVERLQANGYEARVPAERENVLAHGQTRHLLRRRRLHLGAPPSGPSPQWSP